MNPISKPLKVLEMDFWSLKVLHFLLNKVLKEKDRENSVQASQDANEMRTLSGFVFIGFLIPTPVLLLLRAYMLSFKYTTHVYALLVFLCSRFEKALNFKIGSWKVLGKPLNFFPEKVYEPCWRNTGYRLRISNV